MKLTQKMQNKDTLCNLLISLLMFIGSLLVYIATTKNIGVSPDSTIYISVARNIAHGNGFILPVTLEPLTHYPPAYPLLLSLAWLPRIPVLDWVRVINMLFFSGTIFLSWKIAKELNAPLPWLSPLLTTFSPVLLDMHTMAWSEPPYIFLSMVGVHAIAKYLSEDQCRWLIFGGALFGLAWLTRFIGIAAIAAVFVILIRYRKPARSIALFAAVSTLPMFVWITYTLLVAAEPTYRFIALRNVPFIWGFYLVSILITWFLVYWHSVKKFPIVSFISAFGFLYMAFLSVTVCLLDYTPVDTRLLSPIFALSYILVGLLLRLLPSKYYAPTAIVLIVILAGQVWHSGHMALIRRYWGIYQSNGEWSDIVPAHGLYIGSVRYTVESSEIVC